MHCRGARDRTNITIEKVEVPVSAVVDPTDAQQWRKFMGAVKSGIRDHDRSYR